MSAMTDGNRAKMWKWKLEQVVVEKLISLSFCNYSLTVQQAESVHTVSSDIYAQEILTIITRGLETICRGWLLFPT